MHQQSSLLELKTAGSLLDPPSGEQTVETVSVETPRGGRAQGEQPTVAKQSTILSAWPSSPAKRG